MALEELLGTEAGRAELRQLIAAIQRETDEGDAARFSRLQQAIRAQLAADAPELHLLEAVTALLPAEKRYRLADARAIWALGSLLDLLRELGLLPEEGVE